MSKFKIHLSGFNGSYTGAMIAPKINMPTPRGVIVKINEKSIIVRKNENDEHTEKLDSLTFPVWFVPLNYKQFIMFENGDLYPPTALEKAIITLIESDSHDALLAIASVAENIVESKNLKNEVIGGKYTSSGLSPIAVFATIDKLTNY
jgi:hypothetical protein